MTCVPAKCPSYADFTAVQGVTDITPNQSSYGIGNSVSYKCPNGIKRNAICSWDINLKIAYWIYWGRCSGEILVKFLFGEIGLLNLENNTFQNGYCFKSAMNFLLNFLDICQYST